MQPPWGARELERFVRHMRQPRDELRKLDTRLRLDGWQDSDLEELRLAIAQLGQVQGLLLRLAHRLCRVPPGTQTGVF